MGMWLRRIPTRVAGTMALCILGSVRNVSASTFSDVRAGVEYDDNATRAVHDFDVESETFFGVRASGGWRFEAGRNSSLTASGSLDVIVAADADGLSRVAPGMAVAWRVKTRFGADAPAFELRLTGESQSFRSDVREGWVFDVRGAWSQPVGQRFGYRVEARHTSRDAEAESFDQNGFTLAGEAELALRPGTLLLAGYFFRDGDVTSTATPGAVDPRTAPILAASTAKVADDAYPGKIAYRLDAETHGLHVGLSWDIGDSGTLDVTYEYQSIRADPELDYRVNLIRAGYARRF